MSRVFYLVMFGVLCAQPLHKAYGSSDGEEELKGLHKSFKPIQPTKSKIRGLLRHDDGRVSYTFDYFPTTDQVTIGKPMTLKEALDGLPKLPVYNCFSELYAATEERIESLLYDGSVLEEKLRTKPVIEAFCEDIGLEVDEARKIFGETGLRSSAREYIRGFKKTLEYHQKTVVGVLRVVQGLYCNDLRTCVEKECSPLEVLKIYGNAYEEERNQFLKELNVFSGDIKWLNEKIFSSKKSLDKNIFNNTLYFKYRVGNLILSHRLLRSMEELMSLYGNSEERKKYYTPLNDNEVEMLYSDYLEPQQPHQTEKRTRGKRQQNKREVNRSHKNLPPKKEQTEETTPVRNLAFYTVVKAPVVYDLPSAPSLPPGGFKSEYRQMGEPKKVKTSRASGKDKEYESDEEEKEKEHERKSEDKDEGEGKTTRDFNISQDLYVKNPDILDRLLKCQTLEFNEYLNLLVDLPDLNPEIFQEVEFVGQQGTHPAFRLTLQNGHTYRWTVGQAHGGRFIPENHTYRKSYRKPFKYFGISMDNLKDKREKPVEAVKEDKPEKKAESPPQNKKKKRNRKNRKNKGKNNAPNAHQGSDEKKEEEPESAPNPN